MQAEEAGTLPIRKRKKSEDDDAIDMSESSKQMKIPPMSKAREIRLEQNRKAARESRRRKKNMIVDGSSIGCWFVIILDG